ncbi:MAG: CXXX repeat peptide maturase, partial [Paludibacteraceae bacterium]|nr:CXXX repeat peptide maturase [Paludibacteraceae bacterium]
EQIDHVKIVPDTLPVRDGIDRVVRVFDRVPGADEPGEDTAVIRCPLSRLIGSEQRLADLLGHEGRITLCPTDVENSSDGLIEDYGAMLSRLSRTVEDGIRSGRQVSLNVLTDAMMAGEMHNCEAGVSNVTLAPNGRLYLCPAFYYDELRGLSNMMNHVRPVSDRSVGSPDEGLDIRNPQLLRLDHAPLCRRCRAWHCRRCVWLNERMTWDRNTPGREQCVISHTELRVARQLQQRLVGCGLGFEHVIDKVEHLDPFDAREMW